jgi:uncharacterized protein YndB with AHSA1/START domain
VPRHDPVLSHTFRLLTCAQPEQVWGSLLCPERSPRYLHGLSVRTSWEPGAPVHLELTGFPALQGQVLRIEPSHLLSLTVEDAGSGSCTYLTWTLRRSDERTVVRLLVEEAPASGTSEDELEDVWLPVLDRLGELLRDEMG